jgi:hypothetical protein
MAEKNTQSLGPKIGFWLLNLGKPQHETLNQSKSCREFGVKHLLFDKSRNIFSDDDFFQKNASSTFRVK